MDNDGSPPPPPSKDVPSSGENPIREAASKAKAALKDRIGGSSENRPSVRILRKQVSPHAEAHGAGRDQELDPQFGTHDDPYDSSPKGGALNRFRNTVTSFFSEPDDDSYYHKRSKDEYDRETVDLLDVVDPEVSTISTLTNVQNSLFVPSMGKLVNRRPAYRLPERPLEERILDKLRDKLHRVKAVIAEKRGKEAPKELEYKFTFAVLPDGEGLKGWNKEQKAMLDDNVRHMLHSKRAKFKRSMKGFWQYVRRPLGLFITVYATLITLFGAAWVLFLIGWISIGSKKDYVINIVDNVLVALFAIIGDGLAPFRMVDSYHMFFIWRYHRKTWKLRKKLGLPELVDPNDLPDQREEEMEPGTQTDLEAQTKRHNPRALLRRMRQRIGRKDDSIDDAAPLEYSVLTEEEQAELDYHSRKFSKSHTFYKPHETETHYAFPLKLLIATVLLLDMHSALQISLGACTWGISYKTRPFALTTVILCCSITCNIMGGVLISMGDKRTRKKDVIERMMRQELTSEAKEAMEKEWIREAEERGEIPAAVRRRYDEKEEQKREEEHEEIKKAWKDVPLLPKKLLGKGEDHRQPSLPKKGRKSGLSPETSLPTDGSSTSGSAKSKWNFRRKAEPELPSVEETPAQQPAQPQPPARKDKEDEEGMWRRVMRFVRRADLDQS